MKIDHADKKYAIYIAERLESEPGNKNDRWYHTFLMLVDETQQPLKVIQQLHFNDQIGDRGHATLFANARVGISGHDRFKDVLVYPLIGGASDAILGVWNGALAIAQIIKHENIPFDENYKHGAESPNCRAAVIAVLRAMGFEYQQEYFAQDAGTRCTKVNSILHLDFKKLTTIPLSEAVNSNINYLEALRAEWSSGRGRIIEPMQHSFKPMSEKIDVSPLPKMK